MTLGCGSGLNYTNTEASVSATQHPLVAQYRVVPSHRNATAWVEFGTDTTYGRQASTTAATTRYGETLTILVAGMRPNTTYHMRAHVDYSGGSWVDQDQTFTTGAIPTQGFASVGGPGPFTLPGLTVTRPNPGLTPAAGLELLSLIAPANTNLLKAIVTDLDGNIVWYYTDYVFPIKPMQNGHFIVNVGGVLREIDLAGSTIRDVSLSQVNQSLQAKGYAFSISLFHHDMLTLPNGHWIALCNTKKDFTNLPGFPGTTHVLGDALVDIDPNGNVVWAWSGFDHLDVNRHPFGLADFQGLGADWTHSNAIVYTPNDGNLLLSMRNQSWILKIGYQNGNGTGEVLWRLGEEGDFAIDGGDPSNWFYGQHFPNPISIKGPQITMAIFDDGNNRVLDGQGDMCGTPGNPQCYSRAPIFQIDESTKTASVQWQFLPGLFTFWGGSTGQLANGNVEFDMSEPFFNDPNSSLVTEVTQTADPDIVWQMRIEGGNAYRAYRIPSLYPGVTWQQ